MIEPRRGNGMSIEFAEIKVGLELYESELVLRDAMLRRPLGMTLSAEDIAGDSKGWHFGALIEHKVVACVILFPESGGIAKLRQMAVAARLHRQGIGARLLTFAENEARARGIRKIELNARLIARAFYESAGYTAEGEIFEAVTIPHICMSKSIA